MSGPPGAALHREGNLCRYERQGHGKAEIRHAAQQHSRAPAAPLPAGPHLGSAAQGLHQAELQLRLKGQRARAAGGSDAQAVGQVSSVGRRAKELRGDRRVCCDCRHCRHMRSRHGGYEPAIQHVRVRMGQIRFMGCINSRSSAAGGMPTCTHSHCPVRTCHTAGLGQQHSDPSAVTAADGLPPGSK